MGNNLVLGCIADDFTGAGDAASFLVNQGMPTVLLNGVPKGEVELGSCNAVVIALKTRSIDKEKAVRETTAALHYLKQIGAKQFYIKYCSTFDSTKQGNIGPVIDSALRYFQERYTVICPALPVNKRIVKNGVLYVDGVPLAESPMRNHPLNPMWSSSIAELMNPQGQYKSVNIPYQVLEESSADDIRQIVNDFGIGKEHFYVIPDYINETHAEKIIDAFGSLKILTGGSGILAALVDQYKKEKMLSDTSPVANGTRGHGIILAGSCSKATLEQIENFHMHHNKSLKIDPIKLFNKQQTEDQIWNFVEIHQNEDILIYSSDRAENVKAAQIYGKDKIAALLEKTISNIAKRAYANGIKRIIVAGGETSGAVVKALGFQVFIIGKSIAPGVPIMIPFDHQDIRLVLKSGNFGQNDFFSRALNETRSRQ